MQFGQKVFSGPMPLAITVSHITVNLHNRLAAVRAIYKLQSRLIRRSSCSSRRAGADFILNLAARLPPSPSFSFSFHYPAAACCKCAKFSGAKCSQVNRPIAVQSSQAKLLCLICQPYQWRCTDKVGLD